MRALDYITQILLIIGGINWGLVGLFNVDLVAQIFGSVDNLLAEIVYVLVGAAAIYQLFRLFNRRTGDTMTHSRTHTAH